MIRSEVTLPALVRAGFLKKRQLEPLLSPIFECQFHAPDYVASPRFATQRRAANLGLET